jgi:alpha-tubulin suppressor-like RCC1 family protein
MILTKNNELYACGSNEYGQLGLGDTHDHDIFTKVDIPNVSTVTSGEYHTMIITKDNELYSCGCNDVGQLGLGDRKHRNIFTKVNIPTTRCNKVGSKI